MSLKENLRKFNRRWAKVIVMTLRIVIGITFVFSGFVKGVDEWGFIFKLEEYLAVVDITLPRSVTLVAGIFVASFEAICGLLLLIGAYRRSVPLLLGLIMIVMLPLSAWLAIRNPIDDCGCFGDAVTISNWATFIKNIFITAAIVYLMKYNRYVRFVLYRRDLQWLVPIGAFIYMLFVSLISYNVQPMVDFRPYPEGSRIKGDGNEENIVFVYTNGSETKEFTADALPSDSQWEFVERKGEYESGANGIAVYDGDEEVSETVLSDEGQQMIFVVPEINRVDLSYTYFVNELCRICQENGIDFIGLLDSDADGIEWWKDYSMANYNCYSADDTELKSLVRGKMAIIYLEDGVIVWKRTISSLVERGSWRETDYGGNFPRHMTTDLHSRLIRLTVNLLIYFMILLAIEFACKKITRKKKKS